MTDTLNLTKEYFIEKFKAIPDENWSSNGDLQDKQNPAKGCAQFHLGMTYDETSSEVEANALANILLANAKKLSKSDEFLKKIFTHFKDKKKELYMNDNDIILIINDTAPERNLHPKEAMLQCLREC